MTLKTSFNANTQNYGVLCEVTDDGNGSLMLDVWDTQTETSELFYISGAIEQHIENAQYALGRSLSFQIDTQGMLFNVVETSYDSWPSNLQQSADYLMWRDTYARPAFSAFSL